MIKQTSTINLRKPRNDLQLDIQDAHRNFGFMPHPINLQRMCKSTSLWSQNTSPLQEVWAHQSFISSRVRFDQHQVKRIRKCQKSWCIDHLPSILLKLQQESSIAEKQHVSITVRYCNNSSYKVVHYACTCTSYRKNFQMQFIDLITKAASLSFFCSTLEPGGFVTHKHTWSKEVGKVVKPNTREPLGTHIRSFEHTDPIISHLWGLQVKIWLRNLNNGFWLDQNVRDEETLCVPGYFCRASAKQGMDCIQQSSQLD